MTITLPSQIEKIVEEKLKSGRYTSAAEVVAAALEVLDRHERMREQERAELEAKLVEGADQLARGEKIPGEEVYRELKERSAQRRHAHHA